MHSVPDRLVVLITGASSGLGAAVARILAGPGYGLILAARRLDRLQSLAEELSRGGSGSAAVAVRLDVTDSQSVEAVVEAGIEEFGRLDVLINNAAVGSLDWLEKMDPVRDIERQIDVNLLGAIRMAKAVLPHMQARRSGHIVNISSVGGLVGTPTYSLYAATKFGLRGFGEALRREVAAWGISVSTVYPGPFRTSFAAESVRKRRTGITSPKLLVPTAEDVARVVARIIRRPRREVVFPWFYRPVVWLNRTCPWIIDFAVTRIFVIPERQEQLNTGSES